MINYPLLLSLEWGIFPDDPRLHIAPWSVPMNPPLDKFSANHGEGWRNLCSRNVGDPKESSSLPRTPSALGVASPGHQAHEDCI